MDAMSLYRQWLSEFSDDAETVAELAAKGADAIMTDYPDMAYEVLRGGE